jgi:hypothetical protein
MFSRQAKILTKQMAMRNTQFKIIIAKIFRGRDALTVNMD